VVIEAAGAPIGGAGRSAVIPPAEANTKRGGDAATQPPVTMQLKIPEPASPAIAVTPVSVEELQVIDLTRGVTGKLEPVDTQPTNYSSQQCSQLHLPPNTPTVH
jgi:hypothetical protein